MGYVPLDYQTTPQSQNCRPSSKRSTANCSIACPDAERCSEIESQLRNGSLTVSGFVAGVAASELYQQRLTNLPPLLAAATAHLTLLGRSPKPEEISSFIRRRAEQGQRAATNNLLESIDYNDAFGRQRVPYPIGLQTQGGYPLQSLNSTASLVQPNAGQTPPQRPVISTRGQRNRIGQEVLRFPLRPSANCPASAKGAKLVSVAALANSEANQSRRWSQVVRRSFSVVVSAPKLRHDEPFSGRSRSPTPARVSGLCALNSTTPLSRSCGP